MHPAHDAATRWPALDVDARRGRLRQTVHLSPGPVSGQVTAMQDAARQAAEGLWRRDGAVWSRDEAVQRQIADRLGWLASPQLMAEAIERIDSFARSIREARFTDVVLLGMGGSSLAPEVLRAILYDQGLPAGRPRFQVLDSTDPAAVRAAATPASTTLYILASKSGTTIEPNTLAAYFQRVLERTPVPRWTDHFVAITDEGTALAQRARAERFRELFINPSDIGGRYSALSFFGLVPAALMGWNISALVGWALAMLKASEPGADDALANPSVALGLAMGAAARAGRDKLTLLLPP
ncbi:MAG TPA: hypothetical protein VJK49_05025, partial [Candidatus Limnocylindrales bacterium]|nr:hypothetical protein [Candidatus Limnocylindrales bacterium]